MYHVGASGLCKAVYKQQAGQMAAMPALFASSLPSPHAF